MPSAHHSNPKNPHAAVTHAEADARGEVSIPEESYLSAPVENTPAKGSKPYQNTLSTMIKTISKPADLRVVRK